jgi:phenylalanyl-tRNA synthetase beta chain
MKINENWLREWVDTPLSVTEIGERLTLAGLEVEEISPAGPQLPGVVVAHIVAVAPHPDADRLQVCRVFDGSAEHDVVCGASNAQVGLRTAYACPGAVLSEAGEIKLSEIRGVTSRGMLCSAAELGLGEDAAGIMALPEEAIAGTTLVEHLLLDDVVFDIGLTPNRGDCFSAIGIARDLAVLSDLQMKEPQVTPISASNDNQLAISLSDPEGCPRYAGRVVNGINNHAVTPLWMQERLRRCGVRSIHPVVDVTNYVMLELGQPMHAFDLQQLNKSIEVRGAHENEELVLLDGQSVTLESGTLVIADTSSAVALAGVMGGEASAVTSATTDVFLESAYFDPIRLAGVARRYRLHTDASLRFERGVDPTMQVRALERATALLQQICGGSAGPAVLVEQEEFVPLRPAVAFRPASVNRLLGTSISDQRIHEVLCLLGMNVDEREANWHVTPPAFRFDISIEPDLIEEVARIVGYDSIPVILPRADARPATTVPDNDAEHRMRNALVERGYFEAITYSFVALEQARQFHPDALVTPLANPISSDMAVMRPSLWPGLIKAACHNLNRQQEDVRLFEIGLAFADLDGTFSQHKHIAGLRSGAAVAAHWDAPTRESDFFDLKHDVEQLLSGCGHDCAAIVAAQHPALQPGQTAAIVVNEETIGYLGALHPAVAQQYDIVKPLFLFELNLEVSGTISAPQFRPISRFPAVRRDLNIVVGADVSADECLEVVRGSAGEHLRDLQLFDVYRGQGIDSDKKSLTLGLIFQDVSSTLTDDEVEAVVARVLRSLHELVGGLLRE